mgnify:CR=1 FL=1
MIAPHLNPAIDAHMRFRLALQVSNVERLMQCPRSVWSVSFCLHEVRRFRQAYPYGWQVANTTLDNLFREHGVPWDDEDEEKVAAGHDRAQTWQDRAFWRTWVTWRGPERSKILGHPAEQPKPVPVVVMRPSGKITRGLGRSLMMSTAVLNACRSAPSRSMLKTP